MMINISDMPAHAHKHQPYNAISTSLVPRPLGQLRLELYPQFSPLQPHSLHQTSMRTKTYYTKSFHPETPYNGPIIMPSPEPSFRQIPYLSPASDAFQKSHAGIMAPPPPPPPRPSPSPPSSREKNSFPKPNPALLKGKANTASFTQQNIYATLLKQHQDEILRLTEELVAVKKEREELKVKLAAAEALNVNSPIAKRKRLGGKLFGESSGAK